MVIHREWQRSKSVILFFLLFSSASLFSMQRGGVALRVCATGTAHAMRAGMPVRVAGAARAAGAWHFHKVGQRASFAVDSRSGAHRVVAVGAACAAAAASLVTSNSTFPDRDSLPKWVKELDDEWQKKSDYDMESKRCRDIRSDTIYRKYSYNPEFPCDFTWTISMIRKLDPSEEIFGQLYDYWPPMQCDTIQKCDENEETIDNLLTALVEKLPIHHNTRYALKRKLGRAFFIHYSHLRDKINAEALDKKLEWQERLG